MAIWMDLTNSLTQHKGNVVGIVRAELMLAKHLHEIDSSIRFSVLTRYGFREVKKSELKWLFKSKNINDDYKKYQKYKRNKLVKLCNKISKKLAWEVFRFKRHYFKPLNVPKNQYIKYPYKKGDMLFSCGGLGTEKENFYSIVQDKLQDFKLVYTIYDLVMIKENLRHFYNPQDMMFEDYLNWISNNCSGVIYGGKTAQKDAEKYFAENNLPVLPGYPIKWGNDFANITKKSDVLEKFNIKSPYILSVGSVDFKNNYDVIYRAYCMMKQRGLKNIPNLVIVGRIIETCKEFESMMEDNNNIIGTLVNIIKSAKA